MGDLSDRVKKLLRDEALDELLAGTQGEQEIVGPGVVLLQLRKWLVECGMEVELTGHLGYEQHLEPPGGAGNASNGTTPKTLVTEHGVVRCDAPRGTGPGRSGPQIVRKRQRRFEGFDEKILALYSRSLSTRDIEAHLAEIYGVKVGRDLHRSELCPPAVIGLIGNLQRFGDLGHLHTLGDQPVGLPELADVCSGVCRLRFTCLVFLSPILHGPKNSHTHLRGRATHLKGLYDVENRLRHDQSCHRRRAFRRRSLARQSLSSRCAKTAPLRKPCLLPGDQR